VGNLKLGGLASGLDTETLIKQLMSLERRPIALMEQRQSQLITRANAWRDINSRLLTLQNRMADLTSISAATWNARTVSVADSSVLSARTTGTSEVGTYAVDVVGLATSQTWKSELAVVDATVGLGVTGSIVVDGGIGDGKTLTIAATDSLNKIAADINTRKAELGFTASVLKVGDNDFRLVLRGSGSGLGNYFELKDDPIDPLETAGSDLLMTAGTATAATTAANGLVKVNNIDISTSANILADAIPGVTLTLAKLGSTNVTVAKDTQRAVEAVKNFVDQYNSVIEFIDQQSRYDSKTKVGGPLVGESTAQALRTALARTIQDKVGTLPDAVNSLGMIGISSERFAGAGTATGKLRFDQSKFLTAFNSDPESVVKLFTMDDGTNKGVAVRTATLLENYTKVGGFLLTKAKTIEDGATYAKSRINHHDTVILPQKEKRLRDQFTALEKAMSLFQSQGSWLTQQLDALSPRK
jgi:flagellar hook-associated protein 2